MLSYKNRKKLEALFIRFCTEWDIMESPFNLITFLLEKDLIEEEKILEFLDKAEKEKRSRT